MFSVNHPVFTQPHFGTIVRHNLPKKEAEGTHADAFRSAVKETAQSLSQSLTEQNITHRILIRSLGFSVIMQDHDNEPKIEEKNPSLYVKEWLDAQNWKATVKNIFKTKLQLKTISFNVGQHINEDQYNKAVKTETKNLDRSEDNLEILTPNGYQAVPKNNKKIKTSISEEEKKARHWRYINYFETQADLEAQIDAAFTKQKDIQLRPGKGKNFILSIAKQYFKDYTQYYHKETDESHRAAILQSSNRRLQNLFSYLKLDGAAAESRFKKHQVMKFLEWFPKKPHTKQLIALKQSLHMTS